MAGLLVVLFSALAILSSFCWLMWRDEKEMSDFWYAMYRSADADVTRLLDVILRDRGEQQDAAEETES
jgi:hypothetical protein